MVHFQFIHYIINFDLKELINLEAFPNFVLWMFFFTLFKSFDKSIEWKYYFYFIYLQKNSVLFWWKKH